MKQVEFWLWWLRDEVTGKRHKSRWRMKAEDAAHYPGAERVEGTCQVLMLPENDADRVANRMPTTADYGPTRRW